MVLKRQLRQGSEEEGCEISNKRRHLASSICKGLNHGQNLQESLSCLEPMLRKWVQEAVDPAIDSFLRSSSYNQQAECLIPSRSLQLEFGSNLPDTLFTGNRLLSEDRSPVKVALYNSITKQVITHGPLSSLKVTVVVLDGDFDWEDWTSRQFEGKLVKNRDGKRPLVAGESTVMLKNGVGCIGDLSFTDNSSWIRSRKFRLGAKVNAGGGGDETSIREAVSNAFRVKDHRGETYQKHHPPMLDDEVWRLEKIAKDGSSHMRLNDSGIFSVGDFLRLYATEPLRLRAILEVSKRMWDTIIGHATTCNSDDNRYMYTSAHGVVLLFDSIYKVVGVAFDGQNYHPLNSLNNYQMGMVEDLKHHAYRNLREWVPVCDPPIAGYPMLLESRAADTFADPNFQKQGSEHGRPTMVPPTDQLVKDWCTFELGESSHSMQAFNPAFNNSYNFTADSPAGFCIGGNYAGSQLPTDDLPLDYNFQAESSAWQGNGLFLGPGYHGIDIIASGIEIPRPRKRWCKVLAVVKWQVRVRRNVAAHKRKHFHSQASHLPFCGKMQQIGFV